MQFRHITSNHSRTWLQTGKPGCQKSAGEARTRYGLGKLGMNTPAKSLALSMSYFFCSRTGRSKSRFWKDNSTEAHIFSRRPFKTHKNNLQPGPSCSLISLTTQLRRFLLPSFRPVEHGRKLWWQVSLKPLPRGKGVLWPPCWRDPQPINPQHGYDL